MASPQQSYPSLDLCAIPLAPSPDGRPPNFHNPPSLQTTITTISAIMLFLALFITAGRLYANKACMKAADYTMIIAVALDVATVGVILSIARYYRHSWDTPVCWITTKYQKITFAEVMLVGPSLFFAKAAIFLLYLQLFSINTWVRIGAKVGLVFSLIGYFVPTLVFAYFAAPHVGEKWEELQTNGRPLQGVPSGVTIGSLSILIDLYIFVLPLPTLYSLNLAFRKRVQLIALFATAFFGIVASVVCLVYRVKLLSQYESTWTAGNVAIPIIVENNVAVIVGSLPGFAHFLRSHVAEVSLFRTLRCKLNGGSSSHTLPVHKGSGSQKPGLRTFGRTQPRKPQYYELTDSTALNTNVTGTGAGMTSTQSDNEGITRTIAIARDEHESTENR